MLAPRKHRAFAFVRKSKMLRIPFAHLVAIRGFEEHTADSKNAPALLLFDRRLRVFSFRRFHYCPPSSKKAAAAPILPKENCSLSPMCASPHVHPRKIAVATSG